MNHHTAPLTGKQKALLHTARRQLGLDEDAYRDLLEAHAGVRSSNELTQRTFDRVLAHLQSSGFAVKPAPRYQRTLPEESGTVPTPAQLHQLRTLFRELELATEGQRALCQRTIKAPWPQTQSSASKMIECCKAMLSRRRKAQAAAS